MKLKGVVNYVEGVKFDPIPTVEDFEAIKGFMQSDDIKREDLFVYKVLLCDNMVDRDYERFTHHSLEELAKLYIGKVGIEDHSPTVKNTHSRIYKTELVVDKDRKNDLGEPYEYVLGYAYTLNNEKNRQLIEEIQGGLKKEVSVGISNHSLLCSICGHEMYSEECHHKKGEEYEGVKCVGLMDGVDDVYEWSFVAIPSQRKAGVIKSATPPLIKKEAKLMGLKSAALKVLKSASVASEDAQELLDEIDKVDKPDEAMKALQDENEGLKAELEKVKKEVEEARTRRVEEFIDKLIDDMKPRNDKMRALARLAIEELIRVDTDGKLTDESERDIRNELESDEYRPLFEEAKNGSEEDTHAIDEAAALEEEREEVLQRLESGQYSKIGERSKGLDFTHSSASPKGTTKAKQETGVMGIRFREIQK